MGGVVPLSIRFHENQSAASFSLVKLDLKLFNFVSKVFFSSSALLEDTE